MTKRHERVNTEEQNEGRAHLYHSPWAQRVVYPGDEQRAVVPGMSALQRLLAGSNTEHRLSEMVPALVANPQFKELAQHRWNNRKLERAARKIVFSLCSSHQEGWNRQVELSLKELMRHYDQDRARGLAREARAMGVTLEFVCRSPVVERPFNFSYQGDPWLMYPVDEWSEVIPFEAHYNKLLLEKAGYGFDRWYIAEELPKPTLSDRARAGAKTTARALGSAAMGVAAILGAVLSSLALLDPALVGTLDSKAEPG